MKEREVIKMIWLAVGGALWVCAALITLIVVTSGVNNK
jgi:hypothetical protein